MPTEPARDEAFESRLPTPLAKLYRQAYLADTAFDRHLGAFFLWEAAIKLIGSIAIAEWAAGERDPEVVELLQTLRNPTLADWVEYLRRLLPILSDRGHPSFVEVRTFVYLRPHQSLLPRSRLLFEFLSEQTEGRRRSYAQFRVSELLSLLPTYRDQEIQVAAGAKRSEEFYDQATVALRAAFQEVYPYVDPVGVRTLSVFGGDPRSRPSLGDLVGPDPADLRAAFKDATVYYDENEFPVSLSGTALSPLVMFTVVGFDACFLSRIVDSHSVVLLSYSTGRVATLPILAYRDTFLPALLGITFTDSLETDGEMTPVPSDSSPAVEKPVEIPGFSQLKRIAQGGFSTVYEAWQDSIGRVVAIKIIWLSAYSDSTQVRERFRNEIRVLGQISHPNVVSIFEEGKTNEFLYFVSPFVQGETLNHWANRQRERPDDDPFRSATEMVQEVVSGLAAVHAHGWVHGDVKPTNVLVSSATGKPMILDFGLAKRVGVAPEVRAEAELTLEGAIVGTPGYMSPEQARGLDRDFRSDVFSVGVVFWELLTGSRPFDGAQMFDVLQSIVRWTNDRSVRDVNPAIPRDYSNIISKCLEPNPANRYPDAGELAADLRRALSGEAIMARRYTSLESWLQSARRNRLTLLLAAASAVLGAVVTATAFVLHRPAGSNFDPPPTDSTATDPTGWYVAGLIGFLWTFQATLLRRKPEASPAPAALGPLPAPEQPKEPPAVAPPIAPRPPVVAGQEAFSSQTVVLRYPAPIAVAYRRFCARKEPRDRLAQLFDTFEITVKYLLYLAMSDLCALRAKQSSPGPLPRHQGFDFSRKPTRMTVGQWVRALRDAAQVLDKEPDRFFAELPAICGPGSFLDRDIFGWIAENRNLVAHRRGGISLSSEKCVPLLREARTKLERLFQEISFVRRYPLGFVTAGYSLDGGKYRRYRVHSCLGARLAFGADACSVDSDAELPLGVPFVVAPDDSRVLCLWPFLTQRESDSTQRPSLYVFEEIQEDHSFLTATRSSAVDHEDDWFQEYRPAGADGHDWLWEALRKLPHTVDVSPDLRLHEGVSHSLVGRLTGERLGSGKHYKLIAPIARGGFGTVYQAIDTRDNSEVAVKVLEDRDGLDSGDDAGQFRRFQREFDKLKQAGREHSGVIRCFESGNDILGRHEYPWYSMEFAGGGDLNARLVERRSRLAGKLVWELPAFRAEACDEFRSIAAAVSHLHDLNIIHRDVKPANVLILEGGEIRLSDFGLVKETGRVRAGASQSATSSRGAIVGTREYMAPEQERGEAVTKAADVYSLGIVLAELLTGHRPEPESKVAAGSPIDRDPHLDRLPDPLRQLLVRCTDLDPERRPRDAHDLLHQYDLALKRSDSNDPRSVGESESTP